MEIAERNFHLKLQEMCDCYLETDFQKQMRAMVDSKTGEAEENAVKYLSLAIMFAVTQKAAKLSLKRKEEKVTVTVKADEKISLPSPNAVLFDGISQVIRQILHIEADKGEMLLALGLRSGDLELKVKVERESGKEKIKIKFPAL